MTCCSLIVALSLSMGYGDMPEGNFATPMFLRGQPIWVTPVSRRTLLLRLSQPKTQPKHDEVAEVLV